MVAFTPMPRAMVSTATSVNPGLLRSMRNPKRRSCAKCSRSLPNRVAMRLGFAIGPSSWSHVVSQYACGISIRKTGDGGSRYGGQIEQHEEGRFRPGLFIRAQTDSAASWQTVDGAFVLRNLHQCHARSGFE